MKLRTQSGMNHGCDGSMSGALDDVAAVLGGRGLASHGRLIAASFWERGVARGRDAG